MPKKNYEGGDENAEVAPLVPEPEEEKKKKLSL